MADIDERALGPGRTVILPPEGLRVVYRGPIQLRIVPPQNAFDASAFLRATASLGVDVAGISAETLARLNEKLPELMERLLADEEAAATFDRDPGAFRDILGDELAELLVTVRRRVTGMRSPFSAPGSDDSTERPARRRTPRLVTASEPTVEARAHALRQELIQWALARRSNLAALEKSPVQAIERRFADQPEAVRRVLLRAVEEAAQPDA